MWRDYDKFIAELTERFPHEKKGIRKFYDECWRVRCQISVIGWACLLACCSAASAAQYQIRQLKQTHNTSCHNIVLQLLRTAFRS